MTQPTKITVHRWMASLHFQNGRVEEMYVVASDKQEAVQRARVKAKRRGIGIRAIEVKEVAWP